MICSRYRSNIYKSPSVAAAAAAPVVYTPRPRTRESANCVMAIQLHELAVGVLVVVASLSCSIFWVEAQQQQLQPYIPFQNSKFQNDFFVEWSQSNVAAVDGGHTLQLSLNEESGKSHLLTTQKFIAYVTVLGDAFIDDVELVCVCV